MKTLVIAEHDNATLKTATLNAVAAAGALGGEVDILVAGAACSGAAEAAAKVPGVSKVVCADNAAYEHQLAENVSLLVAELGADYDNLLAPSTANGKNIMPRVAALLDVGQISDILSVEGADTFTRPIYAGNVIATVQSSDPKKVITVRTTAFDAVAAEGAAEQERRSVLATGHNPGLTESVRQMIALLRDADAKGEDIKEIRLAAEQIGRETLAKAKDNLPKIRWSSFLTSTTTLWST